MDLMKEPAGMPMVFGLEDHLAGRAPAVLVRMVVVVVVVVQRRRREAVRSEVDFGAVEFGILQNQRDARVVFDSRAMYLVD